MTAGSAKRIFWVGTLSSALIFIALTVDFHRREPEFAHNERITDQVVSGKKVWHKYNCNDCHTILGFGAYYAPDMTKAYYRLGAGNIMHVVMNPEKVYKNSFRKMPKLAVTQQESLDLVAFLKWTAEIENRKWPPQDEKYVRAARAEEAQARTVPRTDLVLGACGGCHSFANQGRDVAGDLSDLARASTFDRETLIRFMLEPAAVSPGSGMPPQQLSREKAELIADFVLGLR
jgi:nitric oxide reductase subunit C